MKRIKIIGLLLIFINLSFLSTVFCQTGSNTKKEDKQPDNTGNFKPSISVGVGLLNYRGTLNDADKTLHFSSFRAGYNIAVEKRFLNFLGASADFMMGTLAYNQMQPTSHLNFETPITRFGINIKAILDNYSSVKFPKGLGFYISSGIGFMFFNPKTDLKDKNGNTYYYWSDGTIRNMAQTGNPSDAQIILRDYKYETTVKDSGTTIKNNSLVIPIKIGATFKVTRALEVDFAVSYNYTFTDYLDGFKSKGAIHNDVFFYSNAALRFNFGVKNEKSSKQEMNNGSFQLVELLDSDQDGVRDFEDECPDTPKGIFVNEKGCPKDDDHDGVPDYLDKQPNTPKGAVVDIDGVAINDNDFTGKNYDSIRNSMLHSGVTEVTLFGPSGTKQVFVPNYEKLIKPGTSFVPHKFASADTNKDGYISPEEVMQVIDMFFEGQNIDFDTTAKINELIEYFFEQ